VRARLERIQKAAQRAAMLTNQLLDYAGRGSLLTEPLDLSRLVGELGELLELTVARKAQLGLRLPPDLPTVQGDAAQLSQVVMNLITNAGEAISAPGGRIDVATGEVAATREDLDRMLLGDELREGPYVFVEVADSGCGMTAETRARIFDPFFTTKFTGRGLGLAAVLGIVRAHRGAIEIESEPGRGTRFRVLFPAGPRAERTASASPAPEPARAALRGTLLVVDDDPGVLEVTAETLMRAGFDVLCAEDGAAALAAFRQHAGEIRVVLLDLNMPGASGEDTFEAIRGIRPEAKIVLISGYSQDRAAGRFAPSALASFLQKPFLPGALVATVRTLLET
jgi:two-component system, cell cycle sensor histidine kinase and response regulator CckA